MPTLAGRHLIAYATSFLNSLSAIGNDVERIALGQAASLRLGTFSVMPSCQEPLHDDQCRPQCFDSGEGGPWCRLACCSGSGGSDCIVAALPPEILQKSDVKSLRVELLYEDELCVVASPKHRLARARALQWAQLDGCRWALPPQGSLLRRAVIDMHMRRAGIMPPTPVAENDVTHFIVGATHARSQPSRRDALAGSNQAWNNTTDAFADYASHNRFHCHPCRSSHRGKKDLGASNFHVFVKRSV